MRVLNERATGRYADLNLAQYSLYHLHRTYCEPSDLLTDRQSDGRLTDYHSCITISWVQLAGTSSLVAFINCELASLVQDRRLILLRQI